MYLLRYLFQKNIKLHTNSIKQVKFSKGTLNLIKYLFIMSLRQVHLLY